MNRRRLLWWAPEMAGAERTLLGHVLDSAYFNEGEITARFERRIAKLLGVSYAVSSTSGTTALTMALMAIGLGPDDEVVVPDLTFIATANAVRLAGARVVLADVDPETLTLAPRAFERALSRRTRAVIPVHVSGRAGTLDRVLQIARVRRIAVVEDAAEALGSRHRGRFLGTQGILGCFSFSPNKTLTTGQGGMVVTSDGALAMKLRSLKDQGRPKRGTGGDDSHDTLGFNFKLTNLQAAVGLAQFARLEERLQRQRRIHEKYRIGLNRIRGIRLLPFDLRGGERPQWTDALAERRDALVARLGYRGIQCRRFWHPVHTQKPYQKPDKLFPNSTLLSSQALWLPSAFQLRDADIRRICTEIKAFYA